MANSYCISTYSTFPSQHEVLLDRDALELVILLPLKKVILKTKLKVIVLRISINVFIVYVYIYNLKFSLNIFVLCILRYRT